MTRAVIPPPLRARTLEGMGFAIGLAAAIAAVRWALGLPDLDLVGAWCFASALNGWVYRSLVDA